MKTIYLAGGCFWGMQKFLDQFSGVLRTEVGYANGLDFYFMVIDPLSYNRQGMDMGVQYRTGVFYTDESQLPAIERVFARETEKAGHKLAVLCEPLKNFFPAEEYHQKYLEKNPGGYCHIPARFYTLGDRT